MVNSSSDSDSDPAVVCGLAHESHDLVVGGVEDGGVVHSHDLVAAEQTPVHVGGAARNDMPYRHLKGQIHA